MEPINFEQHLQTGNVVLFHTKFVWYSPMAWLAAIIRKITGYQYNHVGIIVNNWYAPALNESNAKGVTPTPAMQRLSNRKIKILKPKMPIVEDVFAIRANSRWNLTDYDVWGLVFFQLIYQTFGIWLASKRTSDNERLMTCAEYAAWCYKFAGWNKATPAIFEKSGLFEVVYEN